MRTWIAVIAGILGGFTALAFLFEDEIALTLINPNRSYEGFTPPPAPDYANDSAWLHRGEGSGAADVFFIHENVYRGDGRWNAPYDRNAQLAFLEGTLMPLQSGPFAAQAALWAPRYREPTLYARFTQKRPGAGSRETAMLDVDAAFTAFLAERDPDKPFVLVGYGDGALFAGRLMERVVADDELQRHLAAAYAIGMPLHEDPFGSLACRAAEQSRCLIAFVPIDERFKGYQERLRSKTLTVALDTRWQSSSMGDILCAPPPVTARLRAAKGPAPEIIATELSVRCEDGLFVYETPADRSLRHPSLFGRKFFPDDVNLFYGTLEDDVIRRVATVTRLLEEEAMIAPPMVPAEEIEIAPINKVPG